MWKHEYNTTGGKCQTAGPGRPVSTTNSGNLQISLEPGQKPHCSPLYGQTPEPKCPAGEKNHMAFPGLWRTQGWKWPLETGASLGTTWKESKLRDAWCGLAVIIRLWRGRVVQRPEPCVRKLVLGKEAGGLRKSQCSPFWPWCVYLFQLKRSGFMNICNISPLSSFPAPTASDFSNSPVQCFPNIFYHSPIRSISHIRSLNMCV